MQSSIAEKMPYASGIDALYYFAQSGAFYDRLYEDIINQIEDKKAYFKSLNYQYADNDITVTINEIDVVYSGMGRDGFHWFNHDFFRSGFKDPEKATNIHNIRIQLNAIGIYTLGLKSLIEYVNTKFLGEYTMKVFPITRIDLNMFIQHDFSYLRKEMILSKKQNHSANIGERSNAYELETYYVGKKPFLLRIYNKHKELQSVSAIKREIMHNHFGINGMDLEQPIFNVEFEMHREYLKTFGIDTIDDALKRSETLFKHACDQIRLIDTQSISEKQLNSPNRKRADTLPIWDYIKENYSITEFMQINTPLEKIERISFRYSLQDAEKSIKKVITRLLVHKNDPTLLFFLDVLQKAKAEFELRQNIKNLHEDHTVEPTFEDELKTYSDEGLWNLDNRLSMEMDGLDMDSPLYDDLSYRYIALTNEMQRRKLIPDMF
ncbi:MAG: hypothetical protein CJD30_10645 [Sulfuricurvum sp. PD_MW2]|uniref:hypothetical protein n=1 Tax=Sulfuricurvum sp. PD_MW2 TaxID=2027917 RepID=UPI000C06247C|nr:hypothetical protein [Sulfuricurvum sp. PD_MW2]PHM16608.1 MAG: hypothetical protein CJD30_10645 [Sulfuricurvum sp. PD_MW2]